ncbi:MAG: ribosomal-processing cysteine protease Prp [Lachnospiraceae bacterium]|nr:ribosomal-processing cysteine protease Prp [Lachnospiraceae bacterium]
MIKVNIYEKPTEQEPVRIGFSLEGHAGSAESGHDIVCAAVSMLVINTINSIEELTDERFMIEQNEASGYVKLMFHDAPGERASLLVESMILGLLSVRRDYGKKYISLQTVEVKES